jgi:hypothetical protein
MLLQIAALTLFIPVTDMLPWVQRFKGKPHHEYFGIVVSDAPPKHGTPWQHC